jgi:co-chaperonin GroES (HSP10)
MSFPIIPEGDKIIVTPIQKKEEQVGSIIIPGTTNIDVAYGEVKAIGNEIAHKYKAGDKVIYQAKAGVGDLINGEPCIWITLNNVWGWYSAEEWYKLMGDGE